VATEIADLYAKLSLLSTGFLSGLEEAGAESESFTSKITGMGATAVKGLVVAGVGVAAVAVKMAGDWQSSMVKLVASAGETGTIVNGKLTGPIAGVSKGLLQMAVDTGTSTKQLADGMYYVESAGFHGADGLTVMKMAAEGARAEGADLSTVADALTTALHDMGAGANQSTAYMDMMVKAVGDGKMTMQDLAGSLHSVLPQAAAAGLSFQDVMAAISTMTVAGTSADQATQMLGHTILTLQAPNAIAVKSMAQMGLSATDLSQNLGSRGLLGTFAMIDEAIIKHMGPDGLALQSSFNKSQSAAQNLGIMLSSMPKQLQSISQELEKGSITASDYTTATKAMPANLQAQGAEFLTLYKNSTSFNSALRAGTPDALTFAATLKKVTGDSVTANTIMQAGGANLATFATNEKDVGSAAKEASGNIETWGTITQGFNFKVDQMRQILETTAIKIGTDLLPKLTQLAGYLMSTVAPALGKIGVSLMAAFDSPGMHAAEAVLKQVFQDLVKFVEQVIVAVDNLYRALQPTADFLAHIFFGALEAIGKILVSTIGPAIDSFTKFLSQNAALIRDVAVAALVLLGAKLLYVATLAAVDMFTNFMNGISMAAVGIMKFASAIGSGAWLDTFKLKLLYAKDALNGVATSEEAAGAAGVAAAGESGMGGLLGTLGRSLPIIGAVGVGVYMLGQKISQWTGETDKSAVSVTKLTTALVGLASTTSPVSTAMVQDAEAAFRVGVEFHTTIGFMNSFDQSLVSLVQNGHMDDAKAAFDQLTQYAQANGMTVKNVTDQLPGYEQALDQVTLNQKLNATSTTAQTNALSANSSALGADTTATDGLNSATGTLNNTTAGWQSTLQKQQALTSFNNAVVGLTTSVQTNGQALDSNSAAGIANQQALSGAAQAVADYYQQQVSAGVPVAAATTDMQNQIGQLYEQADKAFPSAKGAVDAYLASLGLVKPSYNTTVNVDTSSAMAKLAALQQTIYAVGGSANNSFSPGGGVKAWATGGLVDGPKGQPQLAIIHGGEYIVTAEEMAGSAPAGSGPKMAIGGGGSVTNVYVTVQGSVLADRDLATTIQTTMLQLGARNSTSYTPYKR
jgi:TP901 family phage tail tape measure protein